MLQMALDATDIDTALASIEHVADKLDVIEIGTILAFAHGVDSVRIYEKNAKSHHCLWHENPRCQRHFNASGDGRRR